MQFETKRPSSYSGVPSSDSASCSHNATASQSSYSGVATGESSGLSLPRQLSSQRLLPSSVTRSRQHVPEQQYTAALSSLETRSGSYHHHHHHHTLSVSSSSETRLRGLRSARTQPIGGYSSLYAAGGPPLYAPPLSSSSSSSSSFSSLSTNNTNNPPASGTAAPPPPTTHRLADYNQTPGAQPHTPFPPQQLKPLSTPPQLPTDAPGFSNFRARTQRPLPTLPGTTPGTSQRPPYGGPPAGRSFSSPVPPQHPSMSTGSNLQFYSAGLLQQPSPPTQARPGAMAAARSSPFLSSSRSFSPCSEALPAGGRQPAHQPFGTLGGPMVDSSIVGRDNDRYLSGSSQHRSGTGMICSVPEEPSRLHCTKHSEEDYEQNEAPLLQELGVNPQHILTRMKSVLLFHRLDQYLLLESDMSGPLIIVLTLGFELLLSGKPTFGYIYGLGLFGCVATYLLLNLMAQSDGIDLYRTMSILGYGLLPVDGLALLSLGVKLRSGIGTLLSVLCILWCTATASRFFETALQMHQQRFLVAYPIVLLYACFVLIIVF